MAPPITYVCMYHTYVCMICLSGMIILSPRLLRAATRADKQSVSAETKTQKGSYHDIRYTLTHTQHTELTT